MSDYDVIVVGGGGAGFAAALTAREMGASVLVVEAADRPGGSTAMCGGVFMAAGTSLQREAGIHDTAEAMYEYIMTLNQWRLEPGLIMAFCRESAPTFEWLRGMGITYRADRLYASGVESVPRGHMTEGCGFALFEMLEQRAGGLGVETVLNTRVRRLLTDDSGAVTGITVDGEDVTARAVILASGGFGSNFALLQTYMPTLAQHGEDWVHYVGSRHNLGDGLLMGQAVGAETEGEEPGGFNLTPNFRKAPDAYLPGWLVIVNEKGRRFMDETAPYAVQDGLVNAQPGDHCFAILDEPARAAARADAEITDPLGLGDTMAYNWVAETLAEQVRKGVVKTADTLLALAAQVGIDGETLVATMDRYNVDVAADCDSLYLKSFRPLLPVATPPFYAVELKASSFGTTGIGLRIDGGGHVLDRHGRPIAGLFAAGEITGGFYGDRYAGGGASLGQALIWGRISGRVAVTELQAQRLAEAV